MSCLLESRNLSKSFFVDKNFWGKASTVIHAVQEVSLQIPAGQTVGLVGESGCGKSTFGRTLLGLYPKTSGTILYKGEVVETKEQLRSLRDHVQMIFQDPYASLNPRMTVEEIITEPLVIRKISDSGGRRLRAKELLELVGLNAEQGQRFPHEFSGGQRQRVGIARALAVNPSCIICDEPISALDVSIQVQIVSILKDLQQQLGLSYLFIAHDLAMVHHISHQIGVMYLGRLVELGPSDSVFKRPLHPYTKALIGSIPKPTPHIVQQSTLSGEVPSPLHPPCGCPFHPRCEKAEPRCAEDCPTLMEKEPGRFVACHRV